MKAAPSRWEPHCAPSRFPRFRISLRSCGCFLCAAISLGFGFNLVPGEGCVCCLWTKLLPLLTPLSACFLFFFFFYHYFVASCYRWCLLGLVLFAFLSQIWLLQLTWVHWMSSGCECVRSDGICPHNNTHTNTHTCEGVRGSEDTEGDCYGKAPFPAIVHSNVF